jgi:polyhydroxyalkanoate synthase
MCPLSSDCPASARGSRDCLRWPVRLFFSRSRLDPPDAAFWVQTDQLRRACGILLDQLGLGPVESPWRTAFAGNGVRLRAYHREGGGPALVIVSAPIKRPYIWDLSPDVSVVRRGLERGWRVFLIEWLEREEEDHGLADYADRLIVDCIDAIRAETNLSRVTLVGHSIGGTLAAVCGAIHPERVAGLAARGPAEVR